ncbi:PQQ-dependent sugar dehydrogenase [Emticicia soli]|uniref:PQQ-dependent sugar dehydrogenase n=1 Tax=Emticicia soli TaxID=2027878 RepID=A0ABW5JCB5_9BACT
MMKYKKFTKLFVGGLFVALQSLAQAPEENRFTKVVLTEKLDEPMEMALLKDGRVLFVERKGALKQYNPTTKEVKTLATIPVNTKYTNREGVKREAEEGLMGLVQDPDFEKNHWIYMYYADTDQPKHILARWELKGEELVESSKKILLEVATQREECCHTGGGMVFDKSGNLYLTVGNNTSNSNSDGYAPIDERANQSTWDDQRGAANTNDLRGKILRIKPEANGTYSIPKGNLFPEGTPNTRPEIYTMGHRNPWRPSIDSKTGYLYWGEVGPDASKDSERGPRGYDEFNQAKGPGFFGWPYFIGDNKAYADWDFTTNKIKADSKFDPAKPINDSPNNTGLKELPPAQKAFIWYPYAISEEFPLVGSSGRSATGGPVYHRSDFPLAKRAFPDYYEGKWLIVEFMRGWIMSVTMDENGNYKSMERFMPNTDFGSAIDIDFAPDGDLYVLEYGTAWFRGNDNARLVKVEYNAGNRKPEVQIAADKTGGAIPLKVNFSSAGTTDADGDALTYDWKVSNKTAGTRTFKTANPTVSFDKPGVYKATLTVTDAKGAKNSKSLDIKVGNEPPVVAFDILKGNKTFYFPNEPIEYDVKVEDKEDGSLSNGKIKPEQVAVNIDYMPIGYDKIEVSQNHRGADAAAFASTGQRLIEASDCKACHVIDKKSVGPSYNDIANKYKGNAGIVEQLAKKVINGGMGVWGEHAMSAHPQLSQTDATSMVEYILSIGEKKDVKKYPIKGSYTITVPEGQKANGSFVLRASYKDRGTKLMPALASEETIVLRHPFLDPELANKAKGTQKVMTPSKSFFMVGSDGYIAYDKIDLTNISHIDLIVQATTRVGAAGGVIEIHLDSPTGPLVGKTDMIEVKEPVPFRPPAAAPAPAAGTQQKPATAPAAAPAPASGMPDINAMLRRGATKASVKNSASGVHDVYFVFKNDKALSTQILMQVMGIDFKSNANL